MTRHQLLRSTLALLSAAVLACGGSGTPTSSVSIVTFEVTVPADTPHTGTVQVIGNHPNLGNDGAMAGLKLRRESAVRFRGQTYLPRGQSITYRLQLESPKADELGADGSEVAPRTVEVGDEDTTVSARVSQWRVTDAPPPAEPAEVTFVVTVPSNTPEGDPVYLSGSLPEFGAWSGPTGYQLTRSDDGKYRGTLTFAAPPGTGLEYKATRGDWGKVEKAEDGSELANRILVIPAVDTTVEITVATWADLGAP